MSNRPRYLLTLEATRTPDDLDGVRRLRGLLKRLLRSHGFRCIECRPAPADRIGNERERAELADALEVQPW